MRSYPYRILNVFAESDFGGNPLCVFEHAEGLSDTEMQALALQFNLSETTFILPSDKATARMRIFTPGTEMAFAGHPSIGTAHVVSALFGASDALTLECKAGIVPLNLHDQIWTFAAPQAVQTRACEATPTEIARLLGLHEDDLLSAPLWVSTGSDQLLVALKTPDAVRRAQPDAALLQTWPVSSLGRRTVYVFAFGRADTGTGAAGRQPVTARYFFVRPEGGVGEDPATGSACANLGGWWQMSGGDLPASFVVEQRVQMRRPSQLYLDVAADKTIRVGGKVVEIGRGMIQIS
ncbi:PhzF family phenazine biosynthesis protein [Undibacterium sp. FT147W]|uniref:PhzF family phenazine biosynthesis protein n=1 Tax=Undibacterium rivi TaxID=2828729 RepID=A0ABS5H1F6_9BURK|nr:PhzF family phenazine biosynthesis protein [Undibacterium rivi]MBR7792453.1 PhzF family phenazine biosynthesis protein [Undibacterium rivi]